jgi:hypothetical protein
MSKEKKKLTHDEYLTALGLFHCASRAQRTCDEFETALNRLLGEDSGSHASDEIYAYAGGSLDNALERMGIEVETKQEGASSSSDSLEQGDE